jgi:hypothetical protein
MKYICVSTNWPINDGCPFKIEVGDIVTLDRIYRHEESGREFYVWVETPDWAWQMDAFAPLSDIDETEMVREYNFKKELV